MSLDLRRETAHFVLLYSAADAGKMTAYANALEAAYPRITNDLGVADMPTVSGHFYPDQASYSAATGHATATGSVEGVRRFHMVAAPLSTSTAVHEFTHNVTLAVNIQSASNPVWLWESIAVYEAGELVPPRQVPCLANRQFPTLTEISVRDGDCDVYQVGYTLAEYIVETWGFDAVRDLVLTLADTRTVLGISRAELERRWWGFIEARYL